MDNCFSSTCYRVKISVIFGARFERRKVDKKKTYMKTETCKLYPRVFWIFLPMSSKSILIFFLASQYRFKVGSFLRHSVGLAEGQSHIPSFVAALVSHTVYRETVYCDNWELPFQHKDRSIVPEDITLALVNRSVYNTPNRSQQQNHGLSFKQTDRFIIAAISAHNWLDWSSLLM